MEIKTNELESIINAIEQDIFESTDGVEYFNISLCTNGFIQFVDFCGIRLWDSEDDCRLYIDVDNEDKREDIEKCLRRRLKEELLKLNSIVV